VPGFAGWLGILVFACIAYAVFDELLED